jgi:hypothetical protein
VLQLKPPSAVASPTGLPLEPVCEPVEPPLEPVCEPVEPPLEPLCDPEATVEPVEASVNSLPAEAPVEPPPELALPVAPPPPLPVEEPAVPAPQALQNPEQGTKRDAAKIRWRTCARARDFIGTCLQICSASARATVMPIAIFAFRFHAGPQFAHSMSRLGTKRHIN